MRTSSLVSMLRKDIGTSKGRYVLLMELTRRLPGELGVGLRRWLLSPRFERAGPGLRIYPGVRLLGIHKLSVGANCRIGYDNTIQANGGVELGDDVLLGPSVKIWSVNHVFSDPHRAISDQGYEHKRVIIGNNVWIGANAFIMPGAHIGDGVIVSAGAVVGGKEVEPYSVVAGNPARKVGSRLGSGGLERVTQGGLT